MDYVEHLINPWHLTLHTSSPRYTFSGRGMSTLNALSRRPVYSMMNRAGHAENSIITTITRSPACVCVCVCTWRSQSVMRAGYHIYSSSLDEWLLLVGGLDSPSRSSGRFDTRRKGVDVIFLLLVQCRWDSILESGRLFLFFDASLWN